MYTVYFEIFGKKMKTKVYASSAADAKIIVSKKVMDKIIFNKIEADSGFKDIMDILGIK